MEVKYNILEFTVNGKGNIKSDITAPCSRLVSIFRTINHCSDTRALFTPALDSPVMHCTALYTALYWTTLQCTMGEQVILCCLVKNMLIMDHVSRGVYANENMVFKQFL